MIFMPLFFEGLTDTEEPMKFLAEEGLKDMLS